MMSSPRSRHPSHDDDERKRAMRSLSLLPAAALMGLLATDGARADVASLAEAKALAAEKNRPLLLDFYTQW
jgi:hypothetical protein